MDGVGQGFDVWYYVLQVDGLQQGIDRFGDESLVFPWLQGLTVFLGDAVLAVEVTAGLAAAAVAAAMASAGGRLGGPWGAALAGAVAVASTGHLALSMEFVKNGVGAVALAVVVQALLGPRPAWGRAVGVALVALFLHKLTAVLAVAALGLAVVATVGASAWRWLLGGLPVALGVGLAGVWTTSDRLRDLPLAGPLDRLHGLARLPPTEAVELGLVPLVPLAMAVGWGTGRIAARPAAVLGGLGLLCAAPGLAFDFDGLAWRLLCMGFLPLGLALAAVRPPTAVAAAVVAVLLGLAPVHVAAHRARSPDYAAWDAVLPVVRAQVPPEDELVAHRGLCGYLWAVGGRRCGNFDPDGTEGVWRVVFGFSEAALADTGPSVPLRPGYRLMAEGDWRRFRDGSDHPWARDPRNPWRPAPPWARRLREAPDE